MKFAYDCEHILDNIAKKEKIMKQKIDPNEVHFSFSFLFIILDCKS